MSYFAVALARTGESWTGVEVDWGTTNGQQTAFLRREGVVFAVVSLTTSTEGIKQILWMMNPSKLSAASAAGRSGPRRGRTRDEQLG